MENNLKNRLAAGKPAIGGWLTVLSPVIAEAMASGGFHWAAIDMEHAPVSEGEIQGVFIALEKCGAAPLVRLPSADPYLARRMLDAGVHGLIVPVVESADAFSAFAQHCLYPPDGTRGVGLARCNGWGVSFDALFLGPYDLSASLGKRGDFTTPEFAAAAASVRETCTAQGKAAGIHQVEPDPAALQARVDEGFGFVAYGTDMIAMRAALTLPEAIK